MSLPMTEFVVLRCVFTIVITIILALSMFSAIISVEELEILVRSFVIRGSSTLNILKKSIFGFLHFLTV